MKSGRVYKLSSDEEHRAMSDPEQPGSYTAAGDIWRTGFKPTTSSVTELKAKKGCSRSYWKCLLVVIGVVGLVLSIVLVLAVPLWIDKNPSTDSPSMVSSMTYTSTVVTDTITVVQNTRRPTCRAGFYQCNDGKCIKQSSRCDSYADCVNGEDELNCRCSSYEVPCTDGYCILQEWICDGVPDCSDGTDENNCSKNICFDTEFECADHSMCVTAGERCDGTKHCSDGSDEYNCIEIIQEDMPNILVIVREGFQRVPVCSENWREEWNQQVCSEIAAGTVISSGTTKFNSSDGFAKSNDREFTANTTILYRLQENINDMCDTNEVVTVTCSYDECGTRSKEYTENNRKKIINGRTANLGEWPWQVMLYYHGSFKCGGVLIAANWVLTAAHCIESAHTKPSRFAVNMGTISKSEEGVTIPVESLFTHQNYNTRTLENDIALMRLSVAVNYTDDIRPICIPPSDYNFSRDVECYTTGWGALDDQADILPNYLQEAKMLLINDTFCANEPDIAIWGLYKKLMLCAGYAHGYVTVCTGDSGGPLVCKNENNKWSVAGITSWGPVDELKSCKGISVFTEVTAYSEWITSIISST